MSKTIRRKNRRISPNSWVLRDWTQCIGFMQYVQLDKDSKEGREAVAKFHSDAGYGDLWYKSRAGWGKYYERRNIRRVCDNALHRYFNGIDEDCVCPTIKHDWLD